MAKLLDGTRIYGSANIDNNLIVNTMNVVPTIVAAFGQANTANTTSVAAFARANAANLIANLAYDKANTANVIASGAYDKANTANITADVAFARANAANLIANLAFDKANSVFLPSVTRLSVTHSGSSAYLIDQYEGNNPTIYVNAGETIAFNLNVTGHPFMIRVLSGSINYDTGLTHVASDGTVSTNASAQGQVTGTLYWKIPFELASNNYVYQCSVHSGMVGTIRIGQPNAIILTHANAAFDRANTANITADASFARANAANLIANLAFDRANTANNLPVQKSGTLIGSRNVLNLIEGTNVTLTVTDDSVGNRINVTIASSGGGGDIGPAFDKANIANVIASAAFDAANAASGGSISDAYNQANTARSQANAAFDRANTANVIASAAFDAANAASGGSVSDAYNQANTARSQANAAFDQANTSNNLPVQKSGTLIGSRNVLNLIEGTNVTLTVTDDSVGNRINVTIASSGGGGGGGSGNSISQTPTQLLASANGLIYTSSTFATSGDASVKKYMLIGTTTSNAPLRLVHGGGNGLISVPSNTTMQYTVDLVARRTDAINESAGWTLKGVADNFSETVADVGNLYEIIIARDDSNYSVDVAANNTSKSLDVIVTGINSETIRWLAFVQTLEVSQ